MIRIDNNYVIKVEPLCYTVCLDLHKVTVNKKTGEETPVYKELAYQNTLYNAIKSVLDHKVKNKLSNKDYSLTEALTELQSINNEFEDILRKATNES